MAATAAGARLTEAHRQAQARLGAQTVRAMRQLFPLLDPEDLDGSFERWVASALTVVRAQRATSARLAANYLSLFRRLELGGTVDDRFVPVLEERPVVEAVTTSLLVTGVVRIRSALGRHVAFDRAVNTAEASSAAAAMRHVLNGGRDTIASSVAADRRALGWARAASGRACGFCAMLASRGPVYSDDTVSFEAHDHCSCTAEPVYHEGATWPAGSQRYAELWQESTRGLGGAEARNAFRLALAAG